MYVTGYTDSSVGVTNNFPTTPDAYARIVKGRRDAYISKFDSSLSTLLASTFLGGSAGEDGLAIAVNSAGDVYSAGLTTSSDFPVTPGAYDENYYVSDVFVSKFTADLTGARMKVLQDTLIIPNSTGSYDCGTVKWGEILTTTFIIENTGPVELLLTGSPTVEIQGDAEAEYRVVTQPASSVAAGASATFEIEFSPKTLQQNTVTISIASNDADANPFTFTLTGYGPFTEIINDNWGQGRDHSHPVLIDLDDDELMDMLIGDETGSILHYEQKYSNTSDFALTHPNI